MRPLLSKQVEEKTSTALRVDEKIPKQVLKLLEMAAELGYSCVPTKQFEKDKELMLSIVKRLKHRTETNVYQAAAYNLTAFPLQLADSLFPKDSVTKSTSCTKTWSLNSVESVAACLGPVLSHHK